MIQYWKPAVAALKWFKSQTDRDKILFTILVCCVVICLGTYTACRILTKDCRRERDEKSKELSDYKLISDAKLANAERICKEELQLKDRELDNCRTEKDVMMKDAVAESTAERRQLQIKLDDMQKFLLSRHEK